MLKEKLYTESFVTDSPVIWNELLEITLDFVQQRILSVVCDTDASGIITDFRYQKKEDVYICLSNVLLRRA
jgi:hypothetical protein